MFPLIIAHRGASADAPENTLAAFKLAWEQGADGFECDVRLTADGRIVCLHDPGTGRVAGRDLIVSESTLAELQQVHPIPTLEEVLALVPAGKRIFIEIKSGIEILAPFTTVWEASRLSAEQTVVISFNESVIAGIKRIIPHVKAFLLIGIMPEITLTQEVMTLVVQKVQSLGAEGVDMNAHPGLNKAFVQTIHKAELECHVWTVDDPTAAKKLTEAGVDSITTNRPGLLKG